MRLNPEKFTFGVRAEKFLGFYITEKRIELSLDKCEAVVQMNSPTSKNDMQRLNGIHQSVLKIVGVIYFMHLFSLLCNNVVKHIVPTLCMASCHR